jgi:hypothetical protein
MEAKKETAEVVAAVVGVGGEGRRGETMAKGKGRATVERAICIECLYAAEKRPLFLEATP